MKKYNVMYFKVYNTTSEWKVTSAKYTETGDPIQLIKLFYTGKGKIRIATPKGKVTEVDTWTIKSTNTKGKRIYFCEKTNQVYILKQYTPVVK